MKRPKRAEELVRHKGCKDCNTHCKHNGLVTTKSKNQQTSDDKYACNTTKQDIKRKMVSYFI